MATKSTESKPSTPDKNFDPNGDVETCQENKSLELSSFGEPPDGGAKAWLVAAGSASTFFCCLGFANSFGVFEEYYLAHQLRNESPDNIAWVGSIASFLQFASGMIGGPLFDRFGAWIVRPAAVAYLFSVMMLSLCDKYWQIMLVQGVLMGFVSGFLQFPAFAAVSQYFEKKRAAALGVVVSGSSIGGIVIPIVLSKLLNNTELGFGWSVRIVGFFLIPFMVFACITIKARLPSRKSTFWIPSAYKNVKFLLTIFSLFFIFIGMLTPLFYIPTYAVQRGMDPTLAGYLLAIINAASTFGRIIPGVLADKFGRINVYSLGAIATGIVIFCMNSATSNAALIVYSIVFGFASGTIISGASAVFSLIPKDPRDIGTYMGMGWPISGLGSLIGPPINGAFLSRYGGFSEVSMFSGAVALLGGLIALSIKMLTQEGIFGRI